MNKTMKILIGVLLVCVVGLVVYLPFYKQQEKYRYWNELIDKNSKPWSVSEEEFIAKNKAGYCWRDKTYYSAKELKDKAMVQFISTLLNEIERARNEELIKDGGEIEGGTKYYCKENKMGCSLWFAPGENKNEYLKKYLLDNIPLFSRYDEELIKFNAQEIIEPKDLKAYSSNINEYALFGNSFMSSYVLGSDCCAVIYKDEFSKIAGYREISGADNFSESGEIPVGEIIENYGVGNYYLSVSYFYYISKIIGFDENKQAQYKRHFDDIKDLYFLSNCGDLLFKPYYSFN